MMYHVQERLCACVFARVCACAHVCVSQMSVTKLSGPLNGDATVDLGITIRFMMWLQTAEFCVFV